MKETMGQNDKAQFLNEVNKLERLVGRSVTKGERR